MLSTEKGSNSMENTEKSSCFCPRLINAWIPSFCEESTGKAIKPGLGTIRHLMPVAVSLMTSMIDLNGFPCRSPRTYPKVRVKLSDIQIILESLSTAHRALKEPLRRDVN